MSNKLLCGVGKFITADDYQHTKLLMIDRHVHQLVCSCTPQVSTLKNRV
jgi:hypothetical protein